MHTRVTQLVNTINTQKLPRLYFMSDTDLVAAASIAAAACYTQAIAVHFRRVKRAREAVSKHQQRGTKTN